MNLYKWTIQLLNMGERRANRPTVRLIVLYRALHDCSLMEAKNLVEDIYPNKEGDYSRINIEFFVDDTALGRLTHAIYARSYFSVPHLQRMCSGVHSFNIIGVNCNV